MDPTPPITLVTGGNRGLGLEVCRQLGRLGRPIVLTARDPAEGERAASSLAAEGLPVRFLPLDVASPASAAALAAALGGARVGVLVNNAGAAFDGFNEGVAERTLAINTWGAAQVTDHLLPLMGEGGQVVMVSSGVGSLSCLSPELRRRFTDPALDLAGLRALTDAFVADVKAGHHRERGWPTSAYAVSKVAMNAYTRIRAPELKARGIHINAVCPGWVRTDMGGPHADRSIEVGAASIVWAATQGPDGPTGGFFRDGGEIGW